MSKLKSVFGAYSDQLQGVVDVSLARFAPTWFPAYFDFGVPTVQLSFVTAIGRARIEAAASIIDRDSRTPLRSRPGLEKLSGEVPAIKEMFKMSETDYRNYLVLQQMNMTDAVKKQQMLDLIFADTKKVGDAAMKKVDMMCLEAVSTGKITVNTTNNPDGLVSPVAIDLLMPAVNHRTALASWETAATATPITDINNTILAGQNAGRSFAKMLMSRSRFLKLAAADETRKMISGYLRVQTKDQVIPILSQVNDYLTANLLPVIEIIDQVIGVEKDGIIQPVRPFSETNVSFIPDGRLGLIHNAIPVEKLKPVTAVSYADYNNALISKWSENEPYGEYTKVELNAFPGLEAINGIFILNTTP